jgi:hypothetical protein
MHQPKIMTERSKYSEEPAPALLSPPQILCELSCHWAKPSAYLYAVVLTNVFSVEAGTCAVKLFGCCRGGVTARVEAACSQRLPADRETLPRGAQHDEPTATAARARRPQPVFLWGRRFHLVGSQVFRGVRPFLLLPNKHRRFVNYWVMHPVARVSINIYRNLRTQQMSVLVLLCTSINLQLLEI